MPHERDSFQTTHWSTILAAADQEDSHSRQAMQELCRRYWFPLYAFARRRGLHSHKCEDLIQSFFLRMLEKDVISKADRQRGRFRNFLLTSLKNFLANESAKASAIRRGGEEEIVSLDLSDAEGRFACEAIDSLTPEAQFHRQWALQVLQTSLDKLACEYSAAGKSELFEALRAYLAIDSSKRNYSEIANQLGMTTAAVKVAAHRLRQRYRQCMEAEILDTVSSRDEVEVEIQDLFSALRSSGP